MTPEIVHVGLPADQPPWTRTGLLVSAGDMVTLLGSGFVRWSRGREAGAGAKYHLWGRVAGGRVFNCTQDTTTARMDRSGELELCVYVGVWGDAAGALATGTAPYQRLTGGLEVTAVRWPSGVDPAVGLAGLDGVPADLVGAELARLTRPVRRPEGWEHLLAFGETDIFRAATVADRPAIDVVCDNDAGILRRPCRLPLDPSSTIEWSWKVDALPSTEPENDTWTHDYLSIALEFDSGRDLTWFWSSALEPVVDTFDCPVRGWSSRETHMPVRRGTDALGVLHRESRNPWEDHRRFMGPPPAHLVAVWLIAVSHFSRGLGQATFTDIRLSTRDGTVQVL